MTKTRQFLLDGATIKSVSPWDTDSLRGWTLLTPPQDPQGIDLLTRRVPWLYRAIEDRALNVSSMPWSIDQGENEIANSEEWAEEKPRDLEWLDNPKQLMYQIEQSLTVAGKAYLRIAINPSGYIKSAKYCNPATIKEIYNLQTGELLHYERNVNSRTVRLTRADMPAEVGFEKCVAFYRQDYQTEIGPGQSSPACAAISAAGVLYNYDKFVADFFGRGAVKATILLLDGASDGERERVQHWWDDIWQNLKSFGALVFRAKGLETKEVGSGVDETEANELITSRRQDISTALGIPESRLWSAAANMATRKEDEAAYYRGTIIPECDLIAETFNEQVFSELHKLGGFRLKFKPDTLDVFQEDEVERTASYNAFMDALMKAPTYDLAIEALNMYGFEFSEAMEKAIKDYFDSKEERAEEVAEQMQPAEPAAPTEQPNESEPDEDEDEQVPPIPARDQEPATRAMLKNWKRKALHVFKMTGKADVPWQTELLSSETVTDIVTKLQACNTKTQIEAVFDGVVIEPVTQTGEVVDPLAAELKRATDLLERILAMPA